MSQKYYYNLTQFEKEKLVQSTTENINEKFHYGAINLNKKNLSSGFNDTKHLFAGIEIVNNKVI